MNIGKERAAIPAPIINYDDLKKAFTEVGVQPGDKLYVAAFMAVLGNSPTIVDDIIDALLHAVGPEGTVVMPTFNFGFCTGEVFDPETTESTCGVLTEVFRKRPDAKRTVHPPYHSVAAIGREAAEIAQTMSLSSFGKDSVFQWLFENDAKHILIGCSHTEGVTHLHWLEEMYEVPYRFWKPFRGTVRVNGRLQEHTYQMFARRLDLGVEWGDVEISGREFEDAGFVQTTEIGLGKIKSFRLQDFYDFMTPKFEKDPLVLLREDLKPLFQAEVSNRTRELECFSE